MAHPTSNILGLNFIDYGSSSCLVQDGSLIAALEEGRLTRSKYTFEFSTMGIERCLAISSLKLQNVDVITLNWNPRIGVAPRIWNAYR